MQSLTLVLAGVVIGQSVRLHVSPNTLDSIHSLLTSATEMAPEALEAARKVFAWLNPSAALDAIDRRLLSEAYDDRESELETEELPADVVAWIQEVVTGEAPYSPDTDPVEVPKTAAPAAAAKSIKPAGARARVKVSKLGEVEA